MAFILLKSRTVFFIKLFCLVFLCCNWIVSALPFIFTRPSVLFCIVMCKLYGSFIRIYWEIQLVYIKKYKSSSYQLCHFFAEVLTFFCIK